MLSRIRFQSTVHETLGQDLIQSWTAPSFACQIGQNSIYEDVLEHSCFPKGDCGNLEESHQYLFLKAKVMPCILFQSTKNSKLSLRLKQNKQTIQKKQNPYITSHRGGTYISVYIHTILLGFFVFVFENRWMLHHLFQSSPFFSISFHVKKGKPLRKKVDSVYTAWGDFSTSPHITIVKPHPSSLVFESSFPSHWSLPSVKLHQCWLN